MDHRDLEIIDQQRGWDGYFKMDVYQLRHRRFDGGQSTILRREVLERGHAVAVLPYDPLRDEVLLIEQFRPGTITAHRMFPDMPMWLHEIVAGIVEDGESMEDVAHRELHEESGCRAIGALERIGQFYVTPGGSSETVTMFYARIDTTHAGGLHGLPEEGEDIRVHIVSADECVAMMAAGKLCNATAMIATQWLMINRARLRRAAGVAMPDANL